MEDEKRMGLVFLPLPGMGHLIAMVELVKHLLQRNPNFSITILTIQPTNPSPQLDSYISSISNSNPNISFHHLPTNDNPNRNILQLIDLQKPNVKSVLADLQASISVVAFVVDFFCTTMVDVSKDLEIPFYLFFTSGAAFLGQVLYLPTLETILPPEKDMEDLHRDGISVHIPSLSRSLPAMALPPHFADRKGEMYNRFVNIAYRFRESDGIIVNSFEDLEPYAVKALQEGKCIPDHPTPPLYLVGPLLNLESDMGPEKGECEQWLDRQPEGSVVFLCFGSMGGFSKEQAREVAIGLERSGCRFLWVLRSAVPPVRKGAPSPPVDANLDEMLQDGFLERTKERGMVWPRFAPQSKILGHKAIGGFVTHCGWNSCLESLWYGVPMLAWPLYAEQHCNATCMVEEMEVAVKLNIDRFRDNWASADEVERGIRCLMDEGKNVRANALKIKDKGRSALKEGGSSYISMRNMVEVLISFTCN